MNSNIKNNIVVATLVVALAGAGVIGVKQVSAQADTTNAGVPSLVQKIATKFNLNQSEVQAVFDQDLQERMAQKQTAYEQHLSQLVTDGMITENQKQLIINKVKELHANHETNKESMQTMTDEQRRAKMNEERQALEKWATDNGIDMQYQRFGKGRHRHSGPGMGMPSTGTQNSRTTSINQ